jgi:hypothetical protein
MSETTTPTTDKVNAVLAILKRIGAWIRGDEYKKEIIRSIDELKEQFNKRVDDLEKSNDENHMEWLRSEITRFYHRAKNGCKIYPDEFAYLSNEVFPRYEKLGGNGVAKKMYDYIFEFYNNQKED